MKSKTERAKPAKKNRSENLKTAETITDAIARFEVETGQKPTRVEVGLHTGIALEAELKELTYSVKQVSNDGRGAGWRQVRSKHCSFLGVFVVPVEEPGIKARRCAEDVIEAAERPLLVAAHTDIQLRVFADTFKIPRNEVRRVASCDDLRGLRYGRHLFLLPDWQDGIRRDRYTELYHVAQAHQMKLFEVAEHEVLGISEEEYRARRDADRRWRTRCANDTDGDGDCHICHGTARGCEHKKAQP